MKNTGGLRINRIEASQQLIGQTKSEYPETSERRRSALSRLLEYECSNVSYVEMSRSQIADFSDHHECAYGCQQMFEGMTADQSLCQMENLVCK